MADFTSPFILQTDASNAVLGAVLLQEFDSQLQPIAYAHVHLPLMRKNTPYSN